MTALATMSYEAAPYSPIHKKIAAGTFMGQICDGYVLGIVGISLSYAVKPLGLTGFWMGLIGAGSMFGIFFGSLFAGMIADRVGRKPLYPVTMSLIALFSLAQFFISDPLLLACARFLLGMAVGADYAVGIALLNEWAPTEKKAYYLSWLLVFWTLGYCIAYVIGFFMETLMSSLGDEGWRWILCTSAIPAIIAMFIRTGSPESPKWLAAKGRKEEGLALIHKFLDKGYDLGMEEDRAPSASWFALFAPAQWRKTMASGIFFFAQVLPFFAISIFLPMVLGALKIDNPHASGVLYNVFTVAGVLIGVPLVKAISRRAYLLSTFYVSAALLVVLIVWDTMPPVLALSFVSALALVLAISIVLEFLYPPELFPTELRASGVGLTIAISRFGAGGGAFLLPVISESYGMPAALWVCAGTLVFGGVICQMWAPETSPRFIKKI